MVACSSLCSANLGEKKHSFLHQCRRQDLICWVFSSLAHTAKHVAYQVPSIWTERQPLFVWNSPGFSCCWSWCDIQDWLGFLSHWGTVYFFNILCGTVTTVVQLTIIIISNYNQKENKNHSTVTLYLQMLLRKLRGEISIYKVTRRDCWGKKEMEIKLICTWLRKKANSESALTYLYFWKQM